MKRLVEFSLADGNSVVVEVDEPNLEGGIQRAARPGEITERATQNLETALDKVRPAAEAILGRLKGLSQAPDKIEVEFGIKISTQVGAIIASGTVEANYVVRLTWIHGKNAE